MNEHVHPVFADILNSFAKLPASPLPSPEEIDRAVHQDKLNDGYFQRNLAQAMQLQLNRRDFF